MLEQITEIDEMLVCWKKTCSFQSFFPLSLYSLKNGEMYSSL